MAESVNPIVTPAFTAAYLWAFRPKPNKKDPTKAARYTVLMLFPKGTDLSPIRAAVTEAAKQKWGSDAKDKVKHPKFKSPFKTADKLVDAEGKPLAGVTEGCIGIEAWSTKPPGVAGPRIDSATGKLESLTTDEEIYSGMRARAQVRPYGWGPNEGGIGISFDLINLQKIGDGEKLFSGRAKAEDAFQPIDAPEDAAGVTGSADSVFDDV